MWFVAVGLSSSANSEILAGNNSGAKKSKEKSKNVKRWKRQDGNVSKKKKKVPP